MTTYSIPGLSEQGSAELVQLLQKRLSAYNDLHLTLKHVHWNVVGPNFIGVHEMIDPQVELVRGYADEVAERIATLGGTPKGTPAAIIDDRTWDDYSLGRGTVPAHLARSEEHTSELQSRQYIVCRLLLEKKKTHTAYLPVPPTSPTRLFSLSFPLNLASHSPTRSLPFSL